MGVLVPNNGDESKGGEADIDTLQARNTRIKRDRNNEYHSNFHGDQTRSVGKEQRYRPNQSPILKRRKWNDINITGEVMIPQEGGLTERIVLVIGGNTDKVIANTQDKATLYTILALAISQRLVFATGLERL